MRRDEQWKDETNAAGRTRSMLLKETSTLQRLDKRNFIYITIIYDDAFNSHAHRL